MYPLFGGDGISGKSGCNSYAGLATIKSGSITMDVQSFVHTDNACRGPDGLMEQEESYLDLLPRLTRYHVYGADNDMFLLFRDK